MTNIFSVISISNKIYMLWLVVLQIPQIIVYLVMPAICLAPVFVKFLVDIIDRPFLTFGFPQIHKRLAYNTSQGCIFIMLMKKTSINFTTFFKKTINGRQTLS